MMIIYFLIIVLNSCHKFIIFGSVDNLWNCACSEIILLGTIK